MNIKYTNVGENPKMNKAISLYVKIKVKGIKYDVTSYVAGHAGLTIKDDISSTVPLHVKMPQVSTTHVIIYN